jgi:hypothetical protein
MEAQCFQVDATMSSKCLRERRVSAEEIGNTRATPEFSGDSGRCVRKGDVFFDAIEFHQAACRTARGSVSLRDTHGRWMRVQKSGRGILASFMTIV